MLKNIFKYEWRAVFPLLLAVHGIGLGVAIICRIGIELMGGVDGLNPSLMAVLLMFAAILAIGCIMAYTYFYGGYRFYKSVFTQQGYLTNTLPVTADQLIWGKGFTMIIWIVLDFLWAVAAIMLLALSPKEAGEFFRELPNAFASIFRPHTPAFTRVILITLIFTPFATMIQFYVSAAIGNLFTGHKLLGTIGAYIGIGFVEQILGLVIMAVTAPHLSVITYHLEETADGITVYNPSVDILTPYLILALIFSILFSVGFYFLCRYVLKHKLNLE